MTVPELNARLRGARPFTFVELVKVGGFLRYGADSFFEGVSV